MIGRDARIAIIDRDTGKETDITETVRAAWGPITYDLGVSIGYGIAQGLRRTFRLKCRIHRQTRGQRLAMCKVFGLPSGRRARRRAHRRRVEKRKQHCHADLV